MSSKVSLNILHFKGNDDVKIFQLSGELTQGNIGKVYDKLVEFVERGIIFMVLDCSMLSIQNTSSLESFVMLHTKIKSKGGSLKICGIDERVMDICRLVGACDILHIYSDLKEAIYRLELDRAKANKEKAMAVA